LNKDIETNVETENKIKQGGNRRTRKLRKRKHKASKRVRFMV
jgi:hypothetical protein